jgi:hypothetical protein
MPLAHFLTFFARPSTVLASDFGGLVTQALQVLAGMAVVAVTLAVMNEAMLTSIRRRKWSWILTVLFAVGWFALIYGGLMGTAVDPIPRHQPRRKTQRPRSSSTRFRIDNGLWYSSADFIRAHADRRNLSRRKNLPRSAGFVRKSSFRLA